MGSLPELHKGLAGNAVTSSNTDYNLPSWIVLHGFRSLLVYSSTWAGFNNEVILLLEQMLKDKKLSWYWASWTLGKGTI